MKSTRSLGGLLSTLGLRDTAQSPEITIAWSYPVQHLVRHGFPHGCVQVWGNFTQTAVAAQHSAIRIIGGAGNTWVKYLNPPTTLADVIMTTRPANNPITPAASVQTTGYAQCPGDNGASSAFFAETFTVATLAGVAQAQRYLLPFSAAVMGTPQELDVIVPRGQNLYFIHPTANSTLTLSIFAWETCPD